ncbi:MAG TPA: nitrogen fixation protein NifH, partial [Thermotogota bacterium]|nr:nitrogen fixation protein NifH [Thermotogota bacterium]
KEKRTSEINNTINKAVEFLLIHHIFKRSHDLDKTSKPGWLKLSFPLMYQTDVLEILDILTELGVADDRMNDAIHIVLSKQDDTGRWRAENISNTDRLLIPLDQKGEQSKWITLRAMRVIKRYR